jgi:uncharacterized membrane protein YqgA involved in biofilm formation
MNNGPEMNPHERSLAAILGGMKQELKEFVETRIAMVKSEFRDKLVHWKLAATLAGAGVVLLVTAYLLITFALVALAAVFIGDTPYRWFFALLGVGVLWTVLSGISLYIAKREFELNRLMPQKTMAVLKGDKLWLQNEARSQI